MIKALACKSELLSSLIELLQGFLQLYSLTEVELASAIGIDLVIVSIDLLSTVHDHLLHNKW
jgi:hypothetical protein